MGHEGERVQIEKGNGEREKEGWRESGEGGERAS